MQSLLFLNKYFLKYKWRLLLGIIFIIISNLFAIIPAQVVRKAFDSMQKGLELLEVSGNNVKSALINEVAGDLLFFGMIIILFALLKGLFMFFMRQTIIVVSRHIEYDLKNEVFSHYQDLGHSFYKVNNTGDLMNRISEDVSKIRMYLGPAVMYSINLAVLFIMVLSTMFLVNPELTIITLIPVPVMGILIFFVSGKIQFKSNKVQEQQSRLATFSQETFSGIRVVQAYNREKALYNLFSELTSEFKNRTLAQVSIEAMFGPVVFFLTGLSTLLALYFGGSSSINGTVSFGTIAEFIMYVNLLTWPVASVGWVTSLIQQAAASQNRLNEFLNVGPEVKNHGTEKISSPEVLEFKNVTFKFKETGITALKNVSFQIKKGATLGILGKTGSGKSTIPLLICRNVEPDSGTILMNEIDIRNIELKGLRDLLGYVPQDVFLFSENIFNNIAFSGDQPEISKIRKSAEMAGILNSIEEFPDQFETIIGERGITLSGGQKQRISIARALNKNPEILIFDDCFSAVDTETEKLILNNLKIHLKDKFLIFISHRISTLSLADQIIILKNGEISESGSPEELKALKGEYFHTLQSQLSQDPLAQKLSAQLLEIK